MQMTKQADQQPVRRAYKSTFAANMDIDLPNYLTELVMVNYLDLIKRSKPTSAFWKKDVMGQDDYLQDLAKIYFLELIGMKQLLKVFDPDIVAGYFLATKWSGFKRLKKDNQMKILYEFYLKQIKKEKVVDTTPVVDILPFDTEKKSYQKNNKIL